MSARSRREKAMDEHLHTAGFVRPKRAVWLPRSQPHMTAGEWIRLIIICLLVGAAIAAAFVVTGCETVAAVVTAPVLMYDEAKGSAQKYQPRDKS